MWRATSASVSGRRKARLPSWPTTVFAHVSRAARSQVTSFATSADRGDRRRRADPLVHDDRRDDAARTVIVEGEAFGPRVGREARGRVERRRAAVAGRAARRAVHVEDRVVAAEPSLDRLRVRRVDDPLGLVEHELVLVRAVRDGMRRRPRAARLERERPSTGGDGAGPRVERPGDVDARQRATMRVVGERLLSARRRRRGRSRSQKARRADRRSSPCTRGA